MDSRLEKAAQTTSSFFVLGVLFVSTALLLVWLARPDYKEFSALTMKANAALGLMLGSLALGLRRNTDSSPSFSKRMKWSRTLAWIQLLIGLITVSEYLFGINLGIDEFLVRDFPNKESSLFPGRMSPIAAICFSLMGISLLCKSTRVGQKGWHLPTLFLAPVLSLTFIAVVGYLYGANNFYQFGPYIRIALPTALCFHFLSLGILLSQPRNGPIRFVFGSTSGGILARRLLPALLTFPLIFGWCGIQAQQQGYVDLKLGTALLVAALVLLFFVIISWTIRALDSLDIQRLALLDSERESKQALEISERKFLLIFENAPFAIALVRMPSTCIADVNPAFVSLFGYSREEVLGKSSVELGMHEDLDARKRVAEEFERTGSVRNQESKIKSKSGRSFIVSNNMDHIELDGQKYVLVTLEDVTEQRRSEESLRSEQHRLLAVLINSPSALSMKNIEGKYLFANPNYDKMLGIPSKSMVGKSDGDIFPKSVAEMLRSHDKKVIETRERLSVEEIIPASDGRLRTFMSHKFPLFDSRGLFESICSISLDVTDRKQAEVALLESENKFRTLANTIPQLAWMTDEKGWIFWYNQRWFDYTGTTLEEMQGLGWKKVHHPEHVNRVVQKFSDFLETGESWEDTFPLRSKDGEWRWFLSRAEPIRDIDGRITRWFGTNTDITERVIAQDDKRFEAALAFKLSKAENAEDLIPIVTQALAKYFHAFRCWVSEIDDSSAEATVQRDFSEGLPSLQGVYALSSFGPEMLASWREGRTVMVSDVKTDPRTKDHWEAHMGLGIRSFITFPLHRAGKLVAALNLSTPNARIWADREIDLVRNVSESLWSTIERARLFESLQRSIRARDEFLSIASHELKTPLTSLKLQTQSMKRSTERGDTKVYSPERVGKLVDQTDRQADRLARLVDDMLDVSRIQTGNLTMQREPVELCGLVKEVVDRMKPQLNTQYLELSLKACEPSIGIWDRLRIEQVMINLLTNAVRYGKGKPIEIQMYCLGKSIRLSVRDQGIGIARENQTRIFNRFERAISATEVSGLGLGLFITKQIVEAHGGRIWVESEVGSGSIFFVELPLAVATQGKVADASL